MADAVTSQTILNGDRNLVMKFTNVSDGTGESAVVKVDVSALGCAAVVIERIHYTTAGMSVNMLWDATTDVLVWAIAPDQTGCLDFTKFAGLKNTSGTGKTGDLLFTTVGHSSGDTYSIVLEMQKVI